MASYDVYKKQADQSTNDYAKKKQAQAATLWESMQGGYDQLNETARKNAETQIENQKQEYRDLHDQNAVQELLDRRYTNEAMANAGLTDSGLNRTQQTAITLERGNRDASLTRQQQAARDATMLALDQMIAENKAKAAAEKAAIDQQVWADVENYRNAQYGAIGDWAEAENAQALALAKLDAEAKQKEADRLAEYRKWAYEKLIEQGTSPDIAAPTASTLNVGDMPLANATQPTVDTNSAEYQATLDLKDRNFEKTTDTVNWSGLSLLSVLNPAAAIADGLTGDMDWRNDVDRDDIVKDGAGNYYKLSELKKALIEDGMNETTAQQFVLNLTKMEKGQTYSGGAISGTKSSEIQKTVKSLKKKVNGTSYTEYSAAEEVIDKLYPNDTTAQKSALSQLGFTDAEIAIMLNAKKG